MEQLRQLEEDAWIAEQLSRTPSQHSKTDVASKPGDSGSSVVTDEWYPDTKHHELGKHYEGITGKQWDWRIPTETVMTKPVPSNKELVYAKVPPIAPDGGDEKMKTLENQLESITRTMEHLLALQTARQVVVAPVQHEELVTEDVVEQLSVMNNDKDDVQHGLITVPLSESTKPSKKDKKNGSKVKEARTSLMPASQLEPSSFLGQILSSGGGPLDDDSSDSSDSSGSDESQPPRAMRRNEDENSSSDYDQSSPTAKGKRPLLKPVNPEKYNGREDAEAFHKYVRQMTEYLGGYKVKKSMSREWLAWAHGTHWHLHAVLELYCHVTTAEPGSLLLPFAYHKIKEMTDYFNKVFKERDTPEIKRVGVPFPMLAWSKSAVLYKQTQPNGPLTVGLPMYMTVPTYLDDYHALPTIVNKMSPLVDCLLEASYDRPSKLTNGPDDTMPHYSQNLQRTVRVPVCSIHFAL
ncbi:hypothetical protein C8Q72DRAFT_884743 [Fomitopsis betulina]|nr:hypothetical protein C8Q72DRAFT_884743 [Fomitopsis betulina]